MRKYVSTEDAINRIMDAMLTVQTRDDDLYNTGLRRAMSSIASMPAADVVEVVRCRDCAHCDDKTPYELWCLGRGWPNQMVPPDGFCDKGKRREAAR